MSRHVDATSARESSKLSRSWPSKPNCTTTADGPTRQPGKTGTDGDLDESAYWWAYKNALVNEMTNEMPSRAARPISVRGGTKLREDATHGGGLEEGEFRALTWSSVLNSFLDWYNGYRNAHLRFVDPDGNTVRGQMPNSHQPRYGKKYYAKLKALERQMLEQYDNLHTAMLTLTGSHRNDNGGWRCPADHLRDVVDSWRPDEGRGVYHALRDALDGQEWEYAIVVEKHQSGYGHVHVAVFVDGEVQPADFHGVIDQHLRVCDIAGRAAHDYHSTDLEERPISVNRVNPDLDPEDYEHGGEHDVYGEVGNLGSYIGEYIGAYGESLFERDISELAFRAVSWATGTQLVRFSTGANEMIRADLDRDDGPDVDPVVVMEPTGDGSGEYKPHVQNAGWELDGVGRVDQEGEEVYAIERDSVQYNEIRDSSHLDPPARQAFQRPQPRTSTRSLNAYCDD